MSKAQSVTIMEKQVQNKSEFNKVAKLDKSEKEYLEKKFWKYADKFMIETFNMSMRIPIRIDGRLTRAGGSYHYGRNGGHLIKLSERFVACALLDEEEGIPAILDVLNHELVHYGLHETGRDFNDGSKDFEETLAKLDIGSSGRTSKDKRLTKKKNVWYNVYDLYYNNVLDKVHLYNHSKKEQNWIGKRIGYKVVKSYFNL